jgi:SAM-dependent methyltransferase
MFEFHADRRRYFEIQIENARDYVIPFIHEAYPIRPGMQVLEIGCGEGGVLKAFTDIGCTGVGVELDSPRLVHARQWMASEIAAGKVRFVEKNIYHSDPVTDLGGPFDIIIFKDVIEHIHDQPRLINWMKGFLRPNGVIFFGFPPWMMPFGGHQQMCKGKWLSKLPWYHLLPRRLYKWILQRNGEPWEALLEIRDTRITIEGFERITRDTGYRVLRKTHYLINPIYQYKFGWKPRRQWPFISAIPWLRNFFTTCVYYLITPKQS